MHKLPDIEFVRECLDYDPATGVFTWRERPRRHFASDRAWWQWNGRYPGTVAGATKGRPVRWFRVIRIDGVTFYAHRIAWLMTHGVDPWPIEIDHIDGDALNNRPVNLRLATSSENKWNMRRRTAATQTGVKGVEAKGDGYVVRIRVNGTRYYIGYYSTLEEATEARRKAAIALHGQFVRHE